MTERPFHHGNLRTVLLDRAEGVLRERGIDALSLRELAREAGVSHGAPRSHFIDRAALLDALAERGFLTLTDEVRAAAQTQPDEPLRALRAAGSAYVGFAVREAALLDLMFAAKGDGPSEPVAAAAEGLFATMTGLVTRCIEAGVIETEHVERLTLLLSATVQGISDLVGSRRVAPEVGELLLDDLVAHVTKG